MVIRSHTILPCLVSHCISHNGVDFASLLLQVANTSLAAILLKDAPKDDTLVNILGLISNLSDIRPVCESSWFLQDTKVELSLPTVVIWQDFGDCLEWGIVLRVKDLDCAIRHLVQIQHQTAKKNAYFFTKSKVKAKLCHVFALN